MSIEEPGGLSKKVESYSRRLRLVNFKPHRGQGIGIGRISEVRHSDSQGESKKDWQFVEQAATTPGVASVSENLFGDAVAASVTSHCSDGRSNLHRVVKPVFQF